MPKPPEAPPSSDLEGVNRDWRAGKASTASKPDPGAALDEARRKSAGRPDSDDADGDEG